MNFENRLKEHIERVESVIQGSFDGESPAHGIIRESMMYSLNAGGKRLRPALLLEVNKLYGGDEEAAVQFALALEMIHTYSLIHDDLPCMDDDDLRRGKPTNHIMFGYDIAVLAGDGLLNLAAEVMLDTVIKNNYLPNFIDAMREILKASGPSGMILGQVADIKYETESMNRETLDFINKNKTGKLIVAALTAGGLLANAPVEDVALLGKIGEDMGLMFQMVDDVLDLTGDPEKLGKRTQMDVKNDKRTYPMLIGIDEVKIQIKAYENRLMDYLDRLSVDTEFLKELVHFLALRDY
ncbi:MAG: polyprenyl synthetase family protein [Clostridiales bacterium]|jgi:geranylgeranyl diphosphate synthase type II|nr:polyprenyl synthetase family protein [Clostridiales bacterium]